MLKGNDLIVWLDGVAIAGSKSCDIQVTCDTIEVSSPTSGEFREYIKGRKGWKVTASGLVTTVKGVIMKVDDEVSLTFGARDLSADVMTGNAICTEAKITGTRGNLCVGSFSFIGNGALT